MDKLKTYIADAKGKIGQKRFMSLSFPLVMGIISFAIAFGTEGSCDTPIREWLIISGATSIGMAVVSGTLTFVFVNLNERKGLKAVVKVTTILVDFTYAAFYSAWQVVGNVWLFTAENCIDDWVAGYAWTLTSVILGYIAVCILSCCCCLLCCICAGVIRAAKAVHDNKDQIKDKAKELDQRGKEIKDQLEYLKEIQKAKASHQKASDVKGTAEAAEVDASDDGAKRSNLPELNDADSVPSIIPQSTPSAVKSLTKDEGIAFEVLKD